MSLKLNLLSIVLLFSLLGSVIAQPVTAYLSTNGFGSNWISGLSISSDVRENKHTEEFPVVVPVEIFKPDILIEQDNTGAYFSRSNLGEEPCEKVISLSLDINSNAKVGIELFDLAGNMILNKDISKTAFGTGTYLFIGELKSGLYILRISSVELGLIENYKIQKL